MNKEFDHINNYSDRYLSFLSEMATKSNKGINKKINNDNINSRIKKSLKDDLEYNRQLLEKIKLVVEERKGKSKK